jgi:hypothetical protein
MKISTPQQPQDNTQKLRSVAIESKCADGRTDLRECDFGQLLLAHAIVAAQLAVRVLTRAVHVAIA